MSEEKYKERVKIQQQKQQQNCPVRTGLQVCHIHVCVTFNLA